METARRRILVWRMLSTRIYLPALSKTKEYVWHGKDKISMEGDCMNLSEIKEILQADVIFGGDMNKGIKMCCGSDLMSDVLAFIKSDSLLLTGITNLQVVRTAQMAEIVAICFVRGKKPPEETINLARESGIPLLTTTLPMYETCGRLYKKGLPGCSEYQGER